MVGEVFGKSMVESENEIILIDILTQPMPNLQSFGNYMFYSKMKVKL